KPPRSHTAQERRLGPIEAIGRHRSGRASAPIRSTLRSTVTAHPATRRSDPEARLRYLEFLDRRAKIRLAKGFTGNPLTVTRIEHRCLRRKLERKRSRPNDKPGTMAKRTL